MARQDSPDNAVTGRTRAIRPPHLTSRSARTVNDEAWPATLFAGVPRSRREMWATIDCSEAASPSGKENTLASADLSFPPSFPLLVYGGLLITRSALGRSTTPPDPLVAVICSCVAEKNDWVSGAWSQSKEPKLTLPDESIPYLRVCNCICSNLIVGDIAASVAAVRWMADWTTSAPLMTCSTRTWWRSGLSEPAGAAAE